MAFKLIVTYLDGKVEEIIGSPLARVQTERHFGGLNATNVQEATFYMAWTHLRKTGGAPDDFDAWLDSMADAKEIEVEDVRPTQPTQPAATSSDSV